MGHGGSKLSALEAEVLERFAVDDALFKQVATALQGSVNMNKVISKTALSNYLRLGIDVNATDKKDNTLLYYAARQNRHSLVDLLLEHPKIEINKRCNRGDTALIIATKRFNDSIVCRLLAHNDIDVKIRNNAGYDAATCVQNLRFRPRPTNLTFKVFWRWEPGHYQTGPDLQRGEIIRQALIDYAASPEELKRKHDLDVAKAKERKAKQLAACAEKTQMLLKAIKTQDEEMINLLVVTLMHETELKSQADRVFDLEVVDEKGKTALMYASIHGDAKLAKQLVQMKADVNACNATSGRTALHIAALGGHADCVAALLAADADKHIRDVTKGATPLDLVKQFAHDDNMDFDRTIKLLEV